MNTTWETVAESLRDEVQEYGGLLRLFEEQQECVFNRDTGRLLELIEIINAAIGRAEDIRRRREDCVSSFASSLGCSPDATLRSLLPCIDDPVRPLLEALIDEVNVLIHRLRQIIRQNHLLFSRTFELQQGLLRQSCPGAFTPARSGLRRVSAAAPGPLAAFRVVS
jgi:hypothetical protein